MFAEFGKTFLYVTLAVCFASGCRPATAPDRGGNTSDDIAAVDNAQNPPSGNDAGSDADNATKGTADEQAEEKPITGTKQRFLLFPPDGPLLIELEILVAGRALDGWVDSVLQEATSLADGNEDGQITWDELFESDELARRFLSDLPEFEQGLDATRERYDRNNDDLVNDYEFRPMLTGNRGAVRSFGLLSSNYYREMNRFASPLFRYLDADFNGSIEPSEIATAASRLMARDFDNDEYVALSDLSQDDTNLAETRNNPLQTWVAIWLGRQDPWNYVSHALKEHYAAGDALAPDHFPLTPELFGCIDENGNGRVATKELPAFTKIAPHIAIRVELCPAKPKAPLITNVTLCESLQAANVTVTQMPEALQISLPTSRIDFFARTVPLRTVEKHAEARMAKLDTDGNQYLTLDEYEAASFEWEGEFAEIDVDKNEQISTDELAKLFPMRQTLVASQVKVRAAHRPDAFFSVLDLDGNQQLAPRELDQLKDTIKRLDRDGDGVLISDELPDRLIVSLTHGDDQVANNMLANPPSFGSNVTSRAPDWFQAMDNNGDGQLSHREFLGKTEQFDALDVDSDGYLSIDESIAVR